MSIETHTANRDPRTALVREKYFSLRPKPLERWLWQQGLPQAAERVFWVHWEEGMKAGDWCSQIPLKRVASLCCVDPSTVTRAYQVLKKLDLIRREDPGRDPSNPFQQATAVTEVRIPRELLVELSRSPNRPRRDANTVGAGVGTEPARRVAATPRDVRALAADSTAASKTGGVPALNRQASEALFRKLSPAERQAYFLASRNRSTAMRFDSETSVTPEERAQLIAQLERMAAERPTPAVQGVAPARCAPALPKVRRMSVLEAARIRRRILDVVAASAAPEILRQVMWAVEEGALRQFDVPLATNIALKKLREGVWTRPNRMPPNWLRAVARAETCNAA